MWLHMKNTVLLISWDRILARTREMLLIEAGYSVTSAVGRVEAELRCSSGADLLVVGHSVPPSEKKEVIQRYRKNSIGPVLSLLRPHQTKLPEADFGVEVSNPAEVVQLVGKILRGSRLG
jgi:DNA-binding response OmpR family regulator